MKTIEERARKYGEQKVGWSLSKSFDEQSALLVIAGKYETEYKSIAEEQEQITKQELIEKACNAYADLLSAHGYNPIDVNNEVVRLKKELEE